MPTLVGLVVILAATLLVYAPAILWGGFLWDDDVLFLNNPGVLAASPFALFFDDRSPDFFPLTTGAFWIQYRLFGTSPLGYHLVNVLLHAAGAMILWRVVLRLGLPGAWVAALLYALHPVAVESAAWIAELKNTLSQVFYFGAIWAYLAFDDAVAKEEGKKWAGAWPWYVFALGLHVAGLLAKTTVAMLPLVLLVLAWYRHGKLRLGSVLGTVPFFAASFVLGVITIHLQAGTSGSADYLATLPPITRRVVEAAWAFWFYVGKMLWPADLVTIYPAFRFTYTWRDSLPLLLVLLCVAGLSVPARSKAVRGIKAAFLYYLVSVLPVLNLQPMIYATISPVADHLVYVALPGIVAPAVALVAGATRPRRAAGAVLAVAALLPCAYVSYHLTWLYQNEEVLWRGNIAADGRSWVPYANLGAHLLARKDRESQSEALRLLREAVARGADQPVARVRLGQGLLITNHPLEARAHFAIAADLAPVYASDYVPMDLSADAEIRVEDRRAAVAALQAALARHPGFERTRALLARIESAPAFPATATSPAADDGFPSPGPD